MFKKKKKKSVKLTQFQSMQKTTTNTNKKVLPHQSIKSSDIFCSFFTFRFWTWPTIEGKNMRNKSIATENGVRSTT